MRTSYRCLPIYRGEEPGASIIRRQQPLAGSCVSATAFLLEYARGSLNENRSSEKERYWILWRVVEKYLSGRLEKSVPRLHNQEGYPTIRF
jgi:hypothetical protein